MIRKKSFYVCCLYIQYIHPFLSVFPRSCGGNIRGTHGIITSPNYPQKYANNQKCKWTIIALIGAKIEIKFDTLHLENGQNCRYDYLEIRDGGDSSAPFIDKFCGRAFPTLIRSTGHMLHLEFGSDGTGTESGFRLEWRAIGVTTTLPPPTNAQTTQKPTTQKPTTLNGRLQTYSIAFSLRVNMHVLSTG